MRKGIVIFVIILLIIFSFILYTNDMQMNECLEFRVSKLIKRETMQLQDSDLFNGEEVIKIYLSENQTKLPIEVMRQTISIVWMNYWKMKCIMQYLWEYWMQIIIFYITTNMIDSYMNKKPFQIIYLKR